MNKRISKRSYYEIKVTLISPLNVGVGRSGSIETDADAIRNGEGKCFVPGTSLAGAFRNYLGDKKDVDSIYGFSKGEEGRLSSIFVSDLNFEGKEVVTVRDRIRLNDDRVVDTGGKFDLEIIEPGLTGSINIEVVERDGDDYKFEQTISDLVFAINAGEVRIGANKNRGLGRLQVESVGVKTFTAENRNEWLQFMAGNHENRIIHVPFSEWAQGKTEPEAEFKKYTVPLKLTGGISIRQYSAEPGEADYSHITSNGRPVIPGTSWSGAIRADAKDILCELGMSSTEAELQIEEWFGRKKGDNIEPAQSKIVFAESVIEGATKLSVARNRIDRFTAGTSDGALYREISYFGGTTELEYMIRKGESTNALRELMQLVVADIKSGIVGIGGLISIGRGVFADQNDDSGKASNVRFDMKELYKVVKGRKM